MAECGDRKSSYRGTSTEDSVYFEDIVKPRHTGHGRSNRSCTFAMSTCSCIMSFINIVFVMFLATKMYTSSKHDISTVSVVSDANHSKQVIEASKFTSSLVDSGSFKIDQIYLKDFNQIRWLSDEKSSIRLTEDGGCLLVANGGQYLVVSKFTFNVPPKNNTTRIFHFLKFLNSSGELKEDGFKRQYVSFVENQLQTRLDNKGDASTLRKTSVLIEFKALESGEQICANVSSTSIELLYRSTIDNDINVIKL